MSFGVVAVAHTPASLMWDVHPQYLRHVVLQADTLGGHFGEPGSNAGVSYSLDCLTFFVKQLGIAPPS